MRIESHRYVSTLDLMTFSFSRLWPLGISGELINWLPPMLRSEGSRSFSGRDKQPPDRSTSQLRNRRCQCLSEPEVYTGSISIGALEPWARVEGTLWRQRQITQPLTQQPEWGRICKTPRTEIISWNRATDRQSHLKCTKSKCLRKSNYKSQTVDWKFLN